MDWPSLLIASRNCGGGLPSPPLGGIDAAALGVPAGPGCGDCLFSVDETGAVTGLVGDDGDGLGGVNGAGPNPGGPKLGGPPWDRTGKPGGGVHCGLIIPAGIWGGIWGILGGSCG